MNESIQNMGPIVRKFVANEIDKAISRHRLPLNSPVRDDLESRAEVIGTRECVVRVSDDAGSSLSLDERIVQLKDDARYSSLFPPDPPRISRSDEEKLRKNFERIARGEVVVE
ncbi:MAG TPA: hypothetical protein VLL05_01830 [Terriglobales bacterium]|nr:hypothetical protein [Terriglobales bacterium]